MIDTRGDIMRLRFISFAALWPKLGLFSHFRQGLAIFSVLLCVLVAAWLVRADVPSGSLEDAKKYYKKVSKDLKFSTP
ncbi:MAG TPA: hypothetical protein VFE62_29190, partial [Gemmataceae bacterium]|nr:hypothetical protein [Gemmataceae bacterium]